MKDSLKSVSHAGHRERLREQFRRGGLDVLDEYRKLELLLFYAVPRQDTNPLAHRLIERFGSLASVFDASYDELLTVDGVGESVATFLKLIPASASYYLNHSSDDVTVFDKAYKIGQYLVNLYIGTSIETVYLMLLDNRHRLIDTVKVHEGSVNSVSINTRALLEPAIIKHASMAVLAHNHPGGVPIPSSEDIITSCTLKDAFDMVGVELLEHFVVAGNGYSPILIKSKGVLRASDPIRKGFYSAAELEFYSQESL